PLRRPRAGSNHSQLVSHGALSCPVVNRRILRKIGPRRNAGMDVHSLINSSVRGAEGAWVELWDLVKDAAGVSIHRLLRSRGLDALLAEDLLQEFFIYLKAHDLRLLRGFQGTCEPQFRAFLRIAASRFALRTLRVWQRNQRRAIAAWTAAPPLTAGPT